MRYSGLLIPLFLLSLALVTYEAQAQSPEIVRKIEALKSELEQLRSEVVEAEEKNASLAGGLVKALVETRIEIIKTTASLIQQRIHALESGAKITLEVSGTQPDEELAQRLKLEIETQLAELKNAREEAAKYSGGLVAAMKQATVATQEQTLAMLRQRYLSAKYGLPVILPPATGGIGSEQGVLGIPSSRTSPVSPDVPADVNTEVISVKLLSKRFAEQNYQEFIWFDIEFTANVLDKPARAIKGILNLQDLFGEPKMRLNWTIDEPIKPGETIVERGTGFEYNQFIDSHQWVQATDLENMTASFVVKSILYQDGSRRDF